MKPSEHRKRAEKLLADVQAAVDRMNEKAAFAGGVQPAQLEAFDRVLARDVARAHVHAILSQGPE